MFCLNTIFILFDTFNILDALTFIVSSIQFTIIGKRKVRAVSLFWLNKCLYGSTHFIFLKHLHSYFINNIYCFVGAIESFREQRGKRIFLFLLNTMLVWFNTIHIFDALTSVLHHSHSLVCISNRPAPGTLS